MELGRLESVDPREAWPHEAHDFTPWLAENLDLLEEATGLRLELVKVEAPVEGFSVDILARDQEDVPVVIENQLEASDHNHLGQIMTYLAGLEARRVIWIAKDFHEAHLSAVRWLNRNTGDDFAFFAVRLKVARIGDSPLAPVFELVEHPDEWERRLRAQAAPGLSERGRFRKEFWEYYSQRYPGDGVPPGRAAVFVQHKTGNPELRINQFLAQDRVGLSVYGRRGVSIEETAEELERYTQVLLDRFDIELGELTTGGLYSLGFLKVDTQNRDNWPQATEWLHERLHELRPVFTDPENGQP